MCPAGSPAGVCTYLRINVSASDGSTPSAGYDYRNSLIFRTISWCAPTDGPGMCSYDQAALAITSVFVDKSNGQIKDGDIEVNAKNFVWADLDVTSSTEEPGSCRTRSRTRWGTSSASTTPATSRPPGRPIPSTTTATRFPDCSAAPADVRATTMFASATPGDIEKRTLACDDVQAVCDIYPLASDPMKCPAEDAPPATGCQCGVGVGPPGAAVVVLMAVGLAVTRRRRARRSRPPTPR